MASIWENLERGLALVQPSSRSSGSSGSSQAHVQGPSQGKSRAERDRALAEAKESEAKKDRTATSWTDMDHMPKDFWPRALQTGVKQWVVWAEPWKWTVQHASFIMGHPLTEEFIAAYDRSHHTDVHFAVEHGPANLTMLTRLNIIWRLWNSHQTKLFELLHEKYDGDLVTATETKEDARIKKALTTLGVLPPHSDTKMSGLRFSQRRLGARGWKEARYYPECLPSAYQLAREQAEKELDDPFQREQAVARAKTAHHKASYNVWEIIHRSKGGCKFTAQLVSEDPQRRHTVEFKNMIAGSHR